MQLMQLNAIAKEASAKPRKNLNRRWTRADPKCNLTYFSFPFPCCIPTYSAVVYLPRSVKQKSSKYSESRLHLIRKRVFLLLFFLVFCKVIFSPGFMFFNVAYRKMNNIAQKKKWRRHSVGGIPIVSSAARYKISCCFYMCTARPSATALVRRL